jgi:hypothetical protein
LVLLQKIIRTLPLPPSLPSPRVCAITLVPRKRRRASKKKEKKMFVSSRSIASVEAAVAAMLDLASHARFLRTSRTVGRMCRLRAASPKVVALWRVVPHIVVDNEAAAKWPWRRRASATLPEKPADQRSSPWGGPPPTPPAVDAYHTRIWTALGRVYFGGGYSDGCGDGYRHVCDLSL